MQPRWLTILTVVLLTIVAAIALSFTPRKQPLELALVGVEVVEDPAQSHEIPSKRVILQLRNRGSPYREADSSQTDFPYGPTLSRLTRRGPLDLSHASIASP